MTDKKVYKIDMGRIELKDYSEKIIATNEWVNWGVRNDFPDVLLQMLYNSSTHFNIVTKRKDLILGDGVVIKKSTQKNEILTQNFIDNINRYGESIDELIEKIAFDFVVFGQSAIQVIWGIGGNKITELLHIPVNNLRYEKKDEYGNINRYFYSENWKKFRVEQYCPIPITPFSTIKEIVDISKTQILLLKPYSPGCSYYTQPSYVGGLNYINLDWQMSEFAQAMIKNGCFPSLVISMANVADDEKDYIVNSFEQQYQNQTNVGKVIFNFVENKDDLKIDNVTPKSQEQLIVTLNNLATENILQSHGCPGVLVGIANAGKLGETNEINNSYLLFENSVIAPDRNLIIKSINKLLKVNNLDPIEITNSTPIPFQASEDLLKDVLTIDEARTMLGYKQLDKSEYGNIVSNVIQKQAATAAAPAPAPAPVKKVINNSKSK